MGRTTPGNNTVLRKGKYGQHLRGVLSLHGSFIFRTEERNAHMVFRVVTQSWGNGCFSCIVDGWLKPGHWAGTKGEGVKLAGIQFPVAACSMQL